MPRLLTFMTLGLLMALGTLYLTGGARVVQVWAMEGQQIAQNAIARGLRALRAEEPAALATLLAVSFGYGFFHAVGPGHGKLLIGGYGAARQIGAVKLSVVALVSSLAQAVSAIALVGAGLLVLGWGRAQMTDLTEDVFAPLSFGAIALIGVWLVWRGVRRLRAAVAAQDLAHAEPAGQVCHTCGHAHAPDPARVAAAKDWRAMAALVGAVAIRPCTGALFLLILTAQMEIFGVGVAGTVFMALGTASVTIAVAIAAVALRRGALVGLGDSPALARVQPAIEIGVGCVIALVAGQLALGLLP